MAARTPARRAAPSGAARRPAAKPAARRPAAKRPVAKRPVTKGAKRAVGRATKGDRPWVMGLVVLAVILGSMAWAPIKNLAAGAGRIEQLTASREQLASEVDALEARKDALMDPEHLELIAREEYGLVKPGEIPYVVVTPEADPQLRGQGDLAELEPKPWYRRVWSALTRLWE